MINSTMILVLHFDGVLGMYEKPFFNSFKNENDKILSQKQNFDERFLFLRRDLKRIINNISKLYIIVMILPQKSEYKDLKNYFINEKFAIDSIYVL